MMGPSAILLERFTVCALLVFSADGLLDVTSIYCTVLDTVVWSHVPRVSVRSLKKAPGRGLITSLWSVWCDSRLAFFIFFLLEWWPTFLLLLFLRAFWRNFALKQRKRTQLWKESTQNKDKGKKPWSFLSRTYRTVLCGTPCSDLLRNSSPFCTSQFVEKKSLLGIPKSRNDRLHQKQRLSKESKNVKVKL